MVKSSNIEEIILVFESLSTLLTTELSPESYFLDGYPDNIESDTYIEILLLADTLYINTTTQIPPQKLLANNKNLCYDPKILEYLLTCYMPLLPLWSWIILRSRKLV